MGTPDGLLDFDRVMEANKASNNGSQLIFSNAVNSHNWYGLLSYYTNKFSDLFKLTAGFDGRFYQGIHREVIDNLLGGDYYIEPQNSSTKLMYHKPYQPLKVGDKIQFDNIGEVLWNGLFAQVSSRAKTSTPSSLAPSRTRAIATSTLAVQARSTMR